ncbi:hypothetical protein ECBCE030MS09_1868 [Escherichia coli BCE030_MS-09]|nr:hypothetical protein ECBCE030MS09_1868 [Escherichia coli BCE030_MS-09]
MATNGMRPVTNRQYHYRTSPMKPGCASTSTMTRITPA